MQSKYVISKILYKTFLIDTQLKTTKTNRQKSINWIFIMDTGQLLLVHTNLYLFIF